jgi:hypothetical protein
MRDETALLAGHGLLGSQGRRLGLLGPPARRRQVVDHVLAQKLRIEAADQDQRRVAGDVVRALERGDARAVDAAQALLGEQPAGVGMLGAVQSSAQRHLGGAWHQYLTFALVEARLPFMRLAWQLTLVALALTTSMMSCRDKSAPIIEERESNAEEGESDAAVSPAPTPEPTRQPARPDPKPSANEEHDSPELDYDPRLRLLAEFRPYRVLAAPTHAVVSASAPRGVTVHARPLLLRATTRDEVGVVVYWERKPLISGRHVRWNPTIESLRVRIEKDGERTTLIPGALEPDGVRRSMPPWASASILLQLSADGLETNLGRSSWKTESPAGLFRAPGTYSIEVEGTLSLVSESIAFSTASMSIELVPPSRTYRAIAALERTAGRAVRSQADGRGGELSPSMPAVDTPSGTRVLRFRLAARTGRSETQYDVEMAPSGKLIGVTSLIIDDPYRTCIAEGTLIATTSGPRPVETIAPGDELWSFDLTSGRKLRTRVRSILSATAHNVLEIDGRLRVTPSHPVFVDGKWHEAGLLRPGSNLLTDALAGHTISDVVVSTEPLGVYSLEVDWPHNYFAGGFLVHNKTPSLKPRTGPWFELWSAIATE